LLLQDLPSQITLNIYKRGFMRKRRAVVIDDDENISLLFKHFLSGLDYEVMAYTEPVVCPVYTGAGSCARQEPCADLIITDYQMPNMTGLELLQAQAERGCKLTPRNKALLSGYIDAEKVEAIQRLGCSYFEKPVSLRKLEGWIKECEYRIDLKHPLGDRRKEQRRLAAAPLPYRVRRADSVVECSAVNVSSDGFCLKLPLPAQPQEILHISSPEPTPARAAIVRWVSRVDDGSFLAGLSFC
jgi:CheY-like chemotaxis protein